MPPPPVTPAPAGALARPPRRARWLLAAWVVLAFALTFPAVGTPIKTGLDPSYMLAFNRFFAGDTVVGRDVVFTYGPLGFLLGPQPVGDNLAWATAFWTAVQLAFTALLGGYLASLPRSSGRGLTVAVFALALVFANLCHKTNLLAFTVALAVAMVALRGARWYGVVSAAAIACAVLIKSSTGILALAVACSFELVHLVARRSPSRHAPFVPAALVLVVPLWLALHGTLEGLGTYLYAITDFSTGNASAMTMHAVVHWVPTALAAAAFLAWPSWSRGRPLRALVATATPPLLIWLKYGVARADHLPLFANLLVLVCVFATLHSRTWRAAGASAAATAFVTAMLSWSLGDLATPTGRDYRAWRLLASGCVFRGPAHLTDALLLPGRRRERLVQASAHHLEKAELDPGVRAAVGDRSVDSYPWETSVVHANDLRWRHRPVFQSYIAYTPWLDGLNAAFFRSDRAPELLLWHHPRLWATDGRYLLNDEPETIYQILARYRQRPPRRYHLLLLERLAEPRLSERRTAGKARALWGRWLDVPPGRGILRARARIRRTTFGSVKRWVYREDPVYIEYRLEGQPNPRHRLPPDNTASGVWIDPYVHNLHPGPARRLFRGPAPAHPLTYEVDELDQEATAFAFRGWAFLTGKDAVGSRVSIALRASRNAPFLLLPAETHERADVAERLGDQRFLRSGFRATWTTIGLPPGKFEVGLLVQRGEDAGVEWLGKILTVIDHELAEAPWPATDVRAVRFLTTDHLSYEDAIDITWERFDVVR